LTSEASIKGVNQIDTTGINPEQVCADIFTIASKLKEKYKAKVFLFGHSSGGSEVLYCLGRHPQNSEFITAGIAMHAPITTDFSPERYNYYRPLYLKNLAREKIAQEKDTIYWSTALQWMEKTDSIHDAASARRWNNYVACAYQSSERKITPGMVCKVIFSAPYNPVNYLYKKDERLVGDILWRADRHLNRWHLLPEITKPILLLSGRYDPIATEEEQEAAHALIPNSELIIIPNSKHWSFLDRPEAFYQAVLNFLKKH
jgi:pimeloyl-ACP methyl ester carboxylesterase